MKIHPVGAQLFHDDGQIDMITFHNSSNPPKSTKIVKNIVIWYDTMYLGRNYQHFRGNYHLHFESRTVSCIKKTESLWIQQERTWICKLGSGKQ